MGKADEFRIRICRPPDLKEQVNRAEKALRNIQNKKQGEKRMIDYDYVTEETKRALERLDESSQPESCEYLTDLLDTCDGLVCTRPYDIACQLLELDRPDPLPGFLVDYITDMYQLEIAEGDAEAMNDLGALYYAGNRGFKQCFEEAVRYYKMAAANGSRQAQENLGYCYYYGRDGERDYKKAFHYFALGAFDGHLISLYKIGDMYLNGLYVEKNETEAYNIFMHCIDIMSEQAAERVAGPLYLRLGRMFLEGIGIRQDFKKALSCYQEAEGYLYDMVKGGDLMYRRSLEAAIAGQEQARKKLAEKLPADAWRFDG